MTTIKLKLAEEIDITLYLKQYSNIVHFAYNRLCEDKNLAQTIKLVKKTVNNIDLMDATLIQSACDNAKSLAKKEKVIFGGKRNWERLNSGLITKEEYQKKKLRSVSVRGDTNGKRKGNRKFQLDIIENNRVIFKPKRGAKIFAKLPATKHYDTLKLLQKLCEANKIYFTCSLNNTDISITFDETILRKEEYKPIKKRILAIDSNPNFVAIVVSDNGNILKKEIIGLQTLNTKSTNKKKHEDFEIVQRIMSIAKHYRVAHIVHEKLEITPSDKKKGKQFNKACNNNWRFSRFLKNLLKHCNIIGIHVQDVIAQYSSFVGQIDNPEEYDSIAAAIELARRGLLFLRKYYYGEKIEVKGLIVRVDQQMSEDLVDRWKKKLNYEGKLDSYKSLYKLIKKLDYSYRVLFQHKWFSLRLKSIESMCFVY